MAQKRVQKNSKNSKLLKISLIISIASILLLLFLSQTLQPKIISIQDINTNMLEKSITIRGRVVSEKDFSDSQFKILNVCDKTACIDVTLSSKGIFKDKTIQVVGKIEEYKNELQINANKIIEIKNVD